MYSNSDGLSGNEVSSKTKTTPKKAWATTERARQPWVTVKYGQEVLPPNDQKSNLPLTAKDVLQPRDEKVGISNAFPILGNEDRFTGGITAPLSGNGRGII